MPVEDAFIWKPDPPKDNRKAMPAGRTAKALLGALGLDPALTVSLDIRVEAGMPIMYKGVFLAAELPEGTA